MNEAVHELKAVLIQWRCQAIRRQSHVVALNKPYVVFFVCAIIWISHIKCTRIESFDCFTVVFMTICCGVTVEIASNNSDVYWERLITAHSLFNFSLFLMFQKYSLTLTYDFCAMLIFWSASVAGKQCASQSNVNFLWWGGFVKEMSTQNSVNIGQNVSPDRLYDMGCIQKCSRSGVGTDPARKPLNRFVSAFRECD